MDLVVPPGSSSDYLPVAVAGGAAGGGRHRPRGLAVGGGGGGDQGGRPGEAGRTWLWGGCGRGGDERRCRRALAARCRRRSEEHTSELQSLMRISYAVFCLKKKKSKTPTN